MDLESCCEELLLAQHIFSSNFNNQITKILVLFYILGISCRKVDDMEREIRQLK